MRSTITLKYLGVFLGALIAYGLALYLLIPEQRLSRWLQSDFDWPVRWQQMEIDGVRLILHGVELKSQPTVGVAEVQLTPGWGGLLQGQLAGDLQTRFLDGDISATLRPENGQYRISLESSAIDAALLAALINENQALPLEGRLDARGDLLVDQQLQVQQGSFRVSAPTLSVLGLNMNDGILEGRWNQNSWVVDAKILGDLLANGKLQAFADRNQPLAFRLKGNLDLQKGDDNPLLSEVLPEGRARLKISGQAGKVQVQCVNSKQYCPGWVGRS